MPRSHLESKVHTLKRPLILFCVASKEVLNHTAPCRRAFPKLGSGPWGSGPVKANVYCVELPLQNSWREGSYVGVLNMFFRIQNIDFERCKIITCWEVFSGEEKAGGVLSSTKRMKDPLIIEMLKLFIKSRHQRRIIPHTSWSMLEHAATSMHTPHSRTTNKYLLIRISDTH